MDILKINGKTIHDPKTLEFQISDLDSEEGSGRNQMGEMFRDRVATKVKLVATFPPMDWSEISTILKAIEPTFFQLEYPDAMLGRRKVITAYVGDRSAPIYIYDKNKNSWIWQGLSVNFIEK